MAEKKTNTLGVLGTVFGSIGLAGVVGEGGLGRLLGGPPPGPPPVSQAELALTAENAQLKAERYTDQQTRPLAVAQAEQAAQIACLNKQIELQAQITDGKINNVAQVSASGLQCLSQVVAALQQSFNSVTKLTIPFANLSGLPLAESGGAVTANAASGGQ